MWSRVAFSRERLGVPSVLLWSPPAAFREQSLMKVGCRGLLINYPGQAKARVRRWALHSLNCPVSFISRVIPPHSPSPSFFPGEGRKLLFGLVSLPLHSCLTVLEAWKSREDVYQGHKHWAAWRCNHQIKKKKSFCFLATAGLHARQVRERQTHLHFTGDSCS